MSTIIKVLLTILVILLIIGGLIVAGGWYWWSEHGEEFLHNTESAHMEGEEFGLTAANEACVAEAFTRIDDCDGLSCEVSVNVFLSSCLAKSQRTPGFCDDVPSMMDFVATTKWRVGRCLEEFRNMEACQQIQTTIQEYCAESADRH